MQYVIYKRFKDTALCGPVNLKATLPCWESEGIIYYEGKPLCFAASENALCHFARDDDGKGLLRGRLIGDIKRRLAKRDGDYQKRWDKVWVDKLCAKFKRKEYADFWIWNKAFHDAEIGELEYVAELIGLEVQR